MKERKKVMIKERKKEKCYGGRKKEKRKGETYQKE